ncbi:MAG: universal stress protein [Nitrospirales bacterium]|nr:universal stress protein [Nitrospirales bacterium]
MADAVFCPVGRLEKLLLATDMSEFSEGAVREALRFAQKCSSKLYALSVLETNPEYETIGARVSEQEEAEAIKHLESVRARAAQEGLDCEIIFHRGEKPHQLIVEEALGKKADMIVIGRRGRKGLAKLLLGEVAVQVIGHAHCKVLVVPRAARIEYRTLLVAVDGSAHSNAAVSEAIAIAQRCGSRIIAVSAIRDEREREEVTANVGRVVERARQEGIAAEALTAMGRSFTVITETAGGRGADLIVMGTYGRTGVRKLLMGSATEKVIANAGCAVLVVRAAPEQQTEAA